MRVVAWALGGVAVGFLACSGGDGGDTAGGGSQGGFGGTFSGSSSGANAGSSGSGSGAESGSSSSGGSGIFTGGTSSTSGGSSSTGGSSTSTGGGFATGGSFASGGTGALDGGCEVEGGMGAQGNGGGSFDASETCGDGLDNNGNGFVDEGCSCQSGTTQPCYSGAPWRAGVGACVLGTQTCITSGEFRSWGPCEGDGKPAIEVCEGTTDENCNGMVDEGCECCSGDTRPCGSDVGACMPGNQTCLNGQWTECVGGQIPRDEVCGDTQDNDCDGETDEGCIIELPVDIDGDCVTASCPAQAPYPVGCQIDMQGGDPRGCVANAVGDSLVYFQEGDACGAGRVVGTLLCSSQLPSSGLDQSNCAINKSDKFFPSSQSGCPDTSG